MKWGVGMAGIKKASAVVATKMIRGYIYYEHLVPLYWWQ